MSLHEIKVNVNGEWNQVVVASNTTLLGMLRETLAFTGTKNGCHAGECGACTVVLDGEAVNSCLVLAVECDGSAVLTVEGLAKDGVLDPLQQAVNDAGGVQCGFCTPGVLMSAHALLQRDPDPDEEAIKEALVGNLCRCTGYVRIIDGIKQAVSV